ncbi:hypothetical protein V6Z11_A08G118400 [Gossypium hirsutum]
MILLQIRSPCTLKLRFITATVTANLILRVKFKPTWSLVFLTNTKILFCKSIMVRGKGDETISLLVVYSIWMWPCFCFFMLSRLKCSRLRPNKEANVLLKLKSLYLCKNNHLLLPNPHYFSFNV